MALSLRAIRSVSSVSGREQNEPLIVVVKAGVVYKVSQRPR